LTHAHNIKYIWKYPECIAVLQGIFHQEIGPEFIDQMYLAKGLTGIVVILQKMVVKDLNITLEQVMSQAELSYLYPSLLRSDLHWDFEPWVDGG
jgi:hypothetical protein